MAEQSYNLKYTGKEIDDLLDKANNMDSSAQVPVGGTSGQVLTKKSGTDYDAEWKTPGSSLPSGGTPSQVLTKKSTAAGDAEWRDVPVQLPSGGSAGQILQKKSSTLNDAGWVDIPSPVNPLPTGGSAGQILAKKSDANFDTEWINQTGGSAFTKTVLWHNNSPTSAFESQTITTTENGFDYPLLIIEFSATAGSVNKLSVMATNTSRYGTNCTLLNYYGGYRTIRTQTGKTWTVSEGFNLSTNATDNNEIMPLNIIGYK